MKALFIGGTGTISTEITALCARKGWELTLLNRGTNDKRVPEGVRTLRCDVNDESAVTSLLGDERFDVVADFIVFTPVQLERDIRLFEGRTAQYLFLSSASAYQKPLSTPVVTEGTPLANPFWEYSRQKIACEERAMKAYRETGFPVTIVRPSHTYCERGIPVALHGRFGSFDVVERIRTGRPVIVPGDGLTLWTVTHSRDFAVGFEGLMGNAHALGEVYQIMGDECLTWNQIHEQIGAALGVKPKLVHIATETLARLCDDYRGALLGDKSNCAIFDTAKIRRAVPAFTTTVRFDQGAREAVRYLYAHPEAQRTDEAFNRWCDAVIERYQQAESELPRLG